MSDKQPSPIGIPATSQEKQRDQNLKRRNQNALNLLMMIVLLWSVIYINNRFTAYFTRGNEYIPGLHVAGKPPQLYQLGLDEQNNPQHSPVPSEHVLKTATGRFNALKAKSGQAKQTPPVTGTVQAKAKSNKDARSVQAELPASAELTSAKNDVDNAKAAIALEYANRLNYTSFTALYVITCLMAIPVGTYIMFNTLKVFPPEEDSVFDAVRRHPKILLGAFAAVVTSGAMHYYFFVHPAPEDVGQILNQTIGHDIDGDPTKLYNAFNSFGMGVTVYLAAVAVCVMWHPRLRPTYESDKVATEARYLGAQLKQLRLVLYISTAVLILRILQTSAGMSWALACLIPQSGTVYDSVKTLVNSFVTVQGVYHTSLLAAIYIPTAAVLSERIAKLADQENMGKACDERAAWLDKHGLSFDAMAQVPSILAILSPLLAGPAKDLISHIGGH